MGLGMDGVGKIVWEWNKASANCCRLPLHSSRGCRAKRRCRRMNGLPNVLGCPNECVGCLSVMCLKKKPLWEVWQNPCPSIDCQLARIVQRFFLMWMKAEN